MNEKYLHEIVIWVRLAGILMIVSIIVAVVFGVMAMKDLTTIVSPPTTTSCLSVGGVDPSC
jgi:hypothetical protein